MRDALRCCLLLLASCGGGSGGGSDPDPPPPPLADVHDTGLAIGSNFARAAILPPRLLFAVSEVETGLDLNGDGDALDQVAHVLDLDTGVSSNLMLAVAGNFHASGGRFAMLVSEPGQGAAILNADGDALDAVWMIYDATQPVGPGNPVSTNVATPSTGLPAASTAGGFLFLWSEAAAGMDLDGDGDQLDEVATAFLEPLGPLVNTGLARAPTRPLAAAGGRVLVPVSEQATNVDRTGDGDLLDIVLVAVDLTNSAQVIALGLGAAVANHPYAIQDGAAAYFLDEPSMGADVNGDMDMTDAVPAVFPFAAGAQFTPIATQTGGLGTAGAPLVGIGAGGGRFVLAVSETSQNFDYNLDMDKSDEVLAWVDATSPIFVHTLGVAAARVVPAVQGPLAIALVLEQGSGVAFGQDFNSDGDAFDAVAFLVDMTAAPGSAATMGVAAGTLFLQGGDALVGIDEFSHQAGDFNSDGAQDDIVPFYADVAFDPARRLNLATVVRTAAVRRVSATEVRIAAVVPEGQSANFGDLNGDGDQADNALVLFSIDPSGDAPVHRAGSPFSAGAADFLAPTPVFVDDDTVAYTTAEAMEGADLNGDGDTNDTVLRYVRYR